MRGSMDKTTVELDGELLEALAIAAPAPLPGSVWHRLFEHGLSRGGRPRKTGRAALPVSGPVTLAGFRKGFLARCRKLADIPDAEFEELLGIYRREGKIPTAPAFCALGISNREMDMAPRRRRDLLERGFSDSGSSRT